MLVNIGGKKVVACDKCGEVINWNIDHNLIYGYTCTKCIDKEMGVYRLVTISKDELVYAGYSEDELSDDIMDELSEHLSQSIMLSDYFWPLAIKFLKQRSIERKK